MTRIARLLRRRSATRERLAALERQFAAHQAALMLLAGCVAEPGPQPVPSRPRLTAIGGGR